jgi:tetratricopeptide (TPR) repeat protein
LALAIALFGAFARRSGGAAAPIRSDLTANVTAYDLYVRGRDPAATRSDSGVRAAIDNFTQAIALDTTFAAAYAGVAAMYANATYASNLTPLERRVMFARASIAARKAVALGDLLPVTHGALGIVRLVGYDVPGGTTELQRTIALDPNSIDTYGYLEHAYEWMERPADGLTEARRALLANPLSPEANAELGRALYFARRYDEALAQLRKVGSLRPPLRRTTEYLAEIYLVKGQWAEAIDVLQPDASHTPRAAALLGYALAKSDARADAERILSEQRVGLTTGAGSAFAVAEVYAGLGDYDQAFVWLDRSFDDYSLWPAIMGPLFDDLRADPRFERVRRRLGLPRR